MAVEGDSIPHPQPLAAVPRGAALFLGVFTLLHLVIALRYPGYDANLWWIDLHPLPSKIPLLAQAALFFVALVCLAYAAAPSMAEWRRRLTRTTMELLGLFMGWNVLNYYGLILRGRTHSALPLPYAVFILFLLFAVWHGSRAARPARGPAAWLVIASTFALLCVAGPTLQVLLFGLLDQRGVLSAALPADAVVLFGNASPEAAAEQVRTAAELLEKNFTASVLLVGTQEQVDAMRKLALKRPIPEEMIQTAVNDGAEANGVHLANEKLNEIDQLRPKQKSLALVVGPYASLPRLKMEFWRDEREVLTAPVKAGRGGAGALTGEFTRLWMYYFDAVRGH